MAKPEPTTVTIAPTSEGQYLVAALLTRKQLVELARLLEEPARVWRGQYQSMAKAIVEAVDEALE